MKDQVLEQIVAKSLDARAGGWGALSTGEKIATAIVLNRFDWLQEMGYTIPQALDRLEDSWVARLRQAERIVQETP